MPKVIADTELPVEDFYASYISTYIERDIREITNIQNESKFLRFLGCLAARTGQELIIEDPLPLDEENICLPITAI